MKFAIEAKNNIIEKVGEMLERAFKKDNLFITLFVMPNVDALMRGERPVYCKVDDEALSKRLDDSFTDAIIRSGMKDKFQELLTFLVSVYNDLDENYRNLKDAAYHWLISFLCDDKHLFRHCAIYLGFASQFGEIVEKFYKKFTNTRMHGKKIYSVDGEQIFHDLYEFSPIASPNFIMDLFDIEDYGEQYELINKKYKEIIQLIIEIYNFSTYSEHCAQRIHADGNVCKGFLENLLEEFKEECMKKSIGGKFTIYPQEIDEAKAVLPKEIVDDISSMNHEDLSKKWYHELNHNARKALAILVWNHINEQQDMTELEFSKVFSHISDLNERNQKAIEARILLNHIGELAQKMVEDTKTGTKKSFDKGKLACLLYEWTGTKISENSFINDYYNVNCYDAEYRVGRSSMNTAKNSNKINRNMEDLFETKAALIIEKYKTAAHLLETASPKQSISMQNTDIPFGLIANQKTQSANVSFASKY